jgi:hypothetical protein
MKKLLTTLLLISSIVQFKSFGQIWADTRGVVVKLDIVHTSNTKQILELVDRIESTTKLAIQTLDNNPNSDPQIKIILQGILSQTVDFKSKLDLYETEIETEKDKQLSSIRDEVEKLLKELERRNGVIIELNNQKPEKIAQAIISYIQEVKILSAELTKKQQEIVELAKQINNKDLEINSLKNEITTQKEINDSLSTELKVKTTELKYLTGGPFKIGLSAGLNYQFSGNTEYIVEPDSTARKLESKGWQGLVSAVIIFHPDTLFKRPNRIDFILNVPIAEIGFGENQSISTIFNKPIALGLGLGYQLASHFSLFGIFNVGSNKVIDDRTLELRKFSEEKFTILDKEKYSTTSVPTYSFSVGFLYKFGNGNR